MLLVIKKGTWGEICHAVRKYLKAKYKYIKEYDKNKESSYSKYWDVNNLYATKFVCKWF